MVVEVAMNVEKKNPVAYVWPYWTVIVEFVVPASGFEENRFTVTSPLGSFAGFPEAS